MQKPNPIHCREPLVFEAHKEIESPESSASAAAGIPAAEIFDPRWVHSGFPSLSWEKDTFIDNGTNRRKFQNIESILN